jgi:dTDP-4-dehydrorhamnose reductase
VIPAGPVAITGTSGRLGAALLDAATAEGLTTLPWPRAILDLDHPKVAGPLLERTRPGIVLHAAAWTDVDGCARDPGLAMRRNADAVAELAAACAATGARLVHVSTNEVFDGERTDGRGYREDDPIAPGNPYGASKAAAEAAVRAALGDAAWIVRTSWLYGPPGPAFPERIVAAADRLPPGEALPVVADETGSPTHAGDLAAAILTLVARTDGGTWHLVNAGRTTRLGWAQAVLAARRPDRSVRPIGRRDFVRASLPPAWGVLDASRAAAAGVVLPAWDVALARYLAGG